MMRFEWDENKNRRNLRKHGVRFETAVLVFDDPHAPTLRDDRVAEEAMDNSRGHLERTRCFSLSMAGVSGTMKK